MTIIIDRNDSSSVYFPKNVPNSTLPDDVTVELTIWSELTQQRVSADLEDFKYESDIVYMYDLSDMMHDMEDGEYNYSIMAISEEGNRELGCGLLRIGKLVAEPEKMNNEPKRIIQYGE